MPRHPHPRHALSLSIPALLASVMLTGVLVLLLVPCGPARAQSGVTVPTDLAGSARIADGDGDGRAVVGSVLESHEIIDEAYNNVTGSEVVASAAGLDGAAAAPRPH